jgi:FkbM family methyltransferase
MTPLKHVLDVLRSRLIREMGQFRDYLQVLGILRGCKWLWIRLIKSRKGSILTLHPWKLGPSLHLRVPSSDVSTFRQVVLRGDYEDIPIREHPSRIIDAGSNIGLAAIVMARKFPSCLIVAVELSPSNFDVLRRNVSQYPNIVAMNAALWSTSSVRVGIDLADGEYWSPRAVVSEAGTGHTCDSPPTVTVSELLARFNKSRCDLLKLDIEGGELEVLGAADDWVDAVDVVVVELHDRFVPGCTTAFEKIANRFPFRGRCGENEYLSRVPLMTGSLSSDHPL